MALKFEVCIMYVVCAKQNLFILPSEQRRNRHHVVSYGMCVCCVHNVFGENMNYRKYFIELFVNNRKKSVWYGK